MQSNSYKVCSVSVCSCVVLAGLLLAGCAQPQPRYTTSLKYEFPTNETGQVCVAQCKQTAESCQQSCGQQQKICEAGLSSQIEQRYADALKHYQTELDHYRFALDRYQLSMDFGFGYRRGWGGGIHYFPRPMFPSYPMPARPHSPNRESIAQQVKKEQCGHDCGCGTAQDTCFIGCGATKVSETQCVANCPNVKEVEPKKEVDAKK